MKVNITPALWFLFFVLVFGILAAIAYFYIEPREITINDAQATIIGSKISENEGLSSRNKLINWDNENNLASLGIGKLLWHQKGSITSELSFSGLLHHLSENQALPDWLNKVKTPPWTSKKDYFLNKHTVFKSQLSYFLQDNISEQIQYLIFNLESSLPKMLKEIKSPFARMHVYENFYHVSMQENGVFTLLDYSLSHGLGMNEKYDNQGWGLLQVLHHMKGDSDNLINEFVTSADLLLTRRELNSEDGKSKRIHLWRTRLQTYFSNTAVQH